MWLGGWWLARLWKRMGCSGVEIVRSWFYYMVGGRVVEDVRWNKRKVGSVMKYFESATFHVRSSLSPFYP